MEFVVSFSLVFSPPKTISVFRLLFRKFLVFASLFTLCFGHRRIEMYSLGEFIATLQRRKARKFSGEIDFSFALTAREYVKGGNA